jgi:hypothetical protein
MWRRIPINEDVLGRPRQVRPLKSSPRSRVWSASFDGTPAVVKQAVGGSDVGERFAREVTALRLAARADPQLAPRVLGVDDSARIMVLEHLPVRERVRGLGGLRHGLGPPARRHHVSRRGCAPTRHRAGQR